MVGAVFIAGNKIAVSQTQNAAKRTAEFAAFQNSPSWRKQAKQFNKNKASAAALFAGADRVQVFRLFPQSGRQEKAQGTLLGNVPFYAKGKEQGAAFASRLGALVLAPKSYMLPGQSTSQCDIEPGVAFRVWRGKQFGDVIVCFECDQLAVLENNPKIPENTIGGWLTGRFVVAGGFNPIRPQLLALAKEALPDSPEVQKL